jgi:hypothetical protein
VNGHAHGVIRADGECGASRARHPLVPLPVLLGKASARQDVGGSTDHLWHLRAVALWLFVVSCLGSLALACFDASAAPSKGHTSDTGSARAPVRVQAWQDDRADFADGQSEPSYGLRLSDSGELALHFESPPAITTGTSMDIRADLTTKGRRAGFIEPLSAAKTDRSADSVAVHIATSSASYAFVLVDLGAGVNVTAVRARTAMFSTDASDKSFASFYRESSNGRYSITGDVIGPYAYAMTTCDIMGMARMIEPQITKTYDHIIYYFNKTQLCPFGGLAEEGSVANPARRTWLNGTLACGSLMHEPGHNLGLMHANTMSCPGASFSGDPAMSCTIMPYGSPWTPMGSGCHQLNGYEKWYERWLSGCDGVRVTSSGTFNLAPLGALCPGATKVLQIPMPGARTVSDPQKPSATVNLRDYYVELRAPAGIFDQYSSGGPAGGFTQPTVTVYVGDDVHPATSLGADAGEGSSGWTELLNMDPAASTTRFAGLQQGVPFNDPTGNSTITLNSLSATGAVVSVIIRNGTVAPTCVDGTTLIGSGLACDDAALGSTANVAEGAVLDGSATGATDLRTNAGRQTRCSGCACESAGAQHRAPADAWLGLCGLALFHRRLERRNGVCGKPAVAEPRESPRH